MRFLFITTWKIFNAIPGKILINFLKGVLPSIWAFYILDRSSSVNIFEKYESLYYENQIVSFVGISAGVYFIFYFVIDFVVRLYFLRRVGRTIFNFFSKTARDMTYLRDLSEMKSGFLEGMDLTIELGYLSRKDVIELKADEPISKIEIEQALHHFGNLFSNWITVLIHLILTLGFSFGGSWILVGVLLIATVVVGHLIFVSLALVISNLNSVPRIKKEVEKRINKS